MRQEIATILQQLVGEGGYVLPIRLVALAANGAMIYVRYTPAEDGSGLDAEMLAQHLPDAEFSLPINLMFVDSNSNATRVRVLVQHDGYQIVH